AAHAVDALVALDAQQVVAAGRRELLEEGGDGAGREIGAAREHARDGAVAGRIDDEALPRAHVSGAQDERSEDGEVEGHVSAESIDAGPRAKPRLGAASQSVRPEATL